MASAARSNSGVVEENSSDMMRPLDEDAPTISGRRLRNGLRENKFCAPAGSPVQCASGLMRRCDIFRRQNEKRSLVSKTKPTGNFSEPTSSLNAGDRRPRGVGFAGSGLSADSRESCREECGRRRRGRQLMWISRRSFCVSLTLAKCYSYRRFMPLFERTERTKSVFLHGPPSLTRRRDFFRLHFRRRRYTSSQRLMSGAEY